MAASITFNESSSSAGFAAIGQQVINCELNQHDEIRAEINSKVYILCPKGQMIVPHIRAKMTSVNWKIRS
jgi:hypothetical protein